MTIKHLPGFLLFGFVMELAGILFVGKQVGFWVTLALMLLAPMAGTTLIRLSGLSFAEAFQSRQGVQSNRPQDARKGIFQFLAGLLLIIPGFLTDVIALILLIPIVQRVVAKSILAKFQVVTSGFGQSPAGGQIIDGEAVEIIPPESRIDDGR